jgi:23S rRNA (adenine1618-N6)-methyltransferase
MPAGEKIKCLDIGVGASCVYPIIGIKEYGWKFVGTDIDKVAIENANRIIETNPVLKRKLELRLQVKTADIFFGVIQKDELFDLTVCNPPFHASYAEAQASTLKKLNNISDEKITEPIMNFGGKNTELWCKGGEQRFVRDMIRQSKFFADSCLWFSTSISKQSHLRSVNEALKKAEAVEIKIIPIGQGNKSCRIVAWTFFTAEQKKNWVETRWKEIV